MTIGEFALQLTDLMLLAAMGAIKSELIRAKMRILEIKHNIIQKVNDWMAEGYQGIKTFALLLIGGAVIVGIDALIIYATKKAQAKATLAVLKNLDFVSQLRLFVGMLKIYDSILAQLSDAYRQVRAAFIEYWEALAEMLGMPVAFISSFLAAYRDYIVTLYRIAGIAEENAHVDWLVNSAKLFKEINDNFRRFVLNPEEVWNFLYSLELAVDPDAVTEIARGSLETTIETVERVDELFGDVGSLTGKVDALAASLPDEIEETLRKDLDPVLERIDAVLKPIVKTVTDITGSVLPELYALADAMQADYSEKIAGIKAALESVWAFFGMDLPNLDAQRRHLSELANGLARDEYRWLDVAGLVAELEERIETEREAPVPTERPEEGISVPGRPPIPTAEGAPGWYVGEDSADTRASPAWLNGGVK